MAHLFFVSSAVTFDVVDLGRRRWFFRVCILLLGDLGHRYDAVALVGTDDPFYIKNTPYIPPIIISDKVQL